MAYNILIRDHFIKAQSMASSYTSPAIEIINQDNICIQLNWSGTPTGTFSVQISADHTEVNGYVTNAGQWTVLTLSPAITASGSADTATIELNQMASGYVQVVYTAGSGSGTLDGYIINKGI